MNDMYILFYIIIIIISMLMLVAIKMKYHYNFITYNRIKLCLAVRGSSGVVENGICFTPLTICMICETPPSSLLIKNSFSFSCFFIQACLL